jgi:uncharacterized protein (TIGR00297 family)
VSSAVRRAGAYALVGSLSLLAPALVGAGALGATVDAPPSVGGEIRAVTIAAALPFLLVAAGGLLTGDDDPMFETFARPGDYEEGRLYSLAGFGLAVAVLVVVAFQFGMPLRVFVAATLLLVYGALAAIGAKELTDNRFSHTAAFAGAAFGAGLLGQLVVASVTSEPFVPANALFLAAAGSLLAALLRSALYEGDDALVVVSVALALWLLADLPTGSPTQVVVGLVVAVVLGYVSYALETASITGMLTGVLLALLTVVLGGYGWFAVLIAFFAVGGLSTRFRYERKRERGIAQENEGARGSGNVLANSAVALAAVLGAATAARTGLSDQLFLFAFTGAVAAAMSDTLSSEIGGLFDNPRLLTTFERVDPGTDGGVTWQGLVAGGVGAAVEAAIAVAFFPFATVAAAVIVAAGVAGMLVDSVLGATVEGRLVDNMTVNFLATLVAALVAVGLAAGLGIVTVPAPGGLS